MSKLTPRQLKVRSKPGSELNKQPCGGVPHGHDTVHGYITIWGHKDYLGFLLTLYTEYLGYLFTFK